MQARSLSPVQTDDVLARGVGSKCEFSFAAVQCTPNNGYLKISKNLVSVKYLEKDDFVIRVSNLHVHSNLRSEVDNR